MSVKGPETGPTIIDGVEVPPMGALVPYDPTKNKNLHGVYCPTPEWIGFDEGALTNEQKAAMCKQFQVPTTPQTSSKFDT
jgi:hypothetical protein